MSTQQRRIAQDWQLAVLRKLRSVSENPTEQQRLAVATETGLNEKWVRNWFARQRSKQAAREQRVPRRSATVTTTVTMRATPLPTYSRDPLWNRYPDFSQFFRPRARQEFYAVQLPLPIDSGGRAIQPLANANCQTSAFFGAPNLVGVPSCPVAFWMRVVDVLGGSGSRV